MKSGTWSLEKMTNPVSYTTTTDAATVDRREWELFVSAHPEGNIFLTPLFHEFYNNIPLHQPVVVACSDNGGKLCGILVAVIQREYKPWYGDFTARAIIWGGPLAAENNTEIAGLLLKKFMEATHTKVVYSQFRNISDMSGYREVFQSQGYVFEDHLDILIDLKKGEQELWAEMHPVRKKQINRAKKRGVTTSVKDKLSQDELNACYQIMAKVYRDIKLPFPDLAFFTRANELLGGIGCLKAIMAWSEDELIGCRFFLVYNGLIYDWYAGSLYSHHDKYPNDILPWEVLRWGIASSQHTFDFGGAGKPGVAYGVRDFKLRFGGTLVNFGRYEAIHRPVIMKLAKLGFRLWRYIKF